MKKICVVLGSRANYSSIKSAMHAIKDHPDLTLSIITTASTLLSRYGTVVNLIESDGFDITERIYTLIEGETPLTMAKSTGLGLIELSSSFERIDPDIVITVGDRFETMATTLAAAYMNIPIAHTMGGEVSGTIDESIRHAVTKFAHIHFPASSDAAQRIKRLGEHPKSIYNVGCPRIDLVRQILDSNNDSWKDCLFETGVGSTLNLDNPFVVISQHPVTTEYDSSQDHILETLKAVEMANIQAIVLWPNADAGSEHIASGIRRWRESKVLDNMHFFKNLPIETYVNLLNNTACLIGNSSSGIREGAFIGTPVVNIGSRQDSRERGKNVLDVDANSSSIFKGIMHQVNHGKYPSQAIYGDGHAGKKIASILSAIDTVNIQKTISY